MKTKAKLPNVRCRKFSRQRLISTKLALKKVGYMDKKFKHFQVYGSYWCLVRRINHLPVLWC